MKWIYLIVAIIGEVVATASLKECEGFTKLWPSVIVLFGYSIAVYFLSLTLKELPVGVAYAIWAGMGMVCIGLIGYFRYSQKLDLPAILGIVLIATGVVVINLFSKSIIH